MTKRWARLEGFSLKATLLTGGWAHPAEQSAPSLVATLGHHGFETTVITSATNCAEQLGEPDLLVVNACWFSMSDDRYNQEQRAEFAVFADPQREQTVRRLTAAGTPVLALHTAVICFDGWDWWGDLLGGSWDWATSGHPPPGPLDVVPTGASDLLAEPFQVVDEEYQGLAMDQGNTMIAQSNAGHPLIWTRTEPARVAVSLLGHDTRSLEVPAHQELLGRLLAWLMKAAEVHP